MQKQLSVIIPIYKVEPYLRKCLDSVVNQTFTDMEIILIDDGSPDDCGKICDEYAVNDERIIVIHKQNGGLCAARNDGIEKATGKWLTFVDSDDWCDTDYYENMFIELGNQSADIFMAGGHYMEFDDKQVMKYNCHEPHVYSTREQLDLLMAKILAPQCNAKEDGVHASSAGSPWDKLYSTEFIKANDLKFDVESKAWEDLLFNFYVFDKAKKIVGGTCIGYHYRMITTSIMKSYNPRREEINYAFIGKLKTYMQKRTDSELIQKAIQVRSINMIANIMRCYYFNDANLETYRETVKRVNEMKQKEYYKDAIWCKNNELFSRGQRVLKLLLKLPVVWPLKIATNRRIKKRY